MSKTFSPQLHETLLRILAHSDYVERYLDLCTNYAKRRDVNYGPRLDMAQTASIFEAHGVTCEWDKRFKMFLFDEEVVAGWSWTGSLVVQRYDSLEPMLKGLSLDGKQSVGSTLLSLAVDAGDLREPPTPRSNFLPPIPNRPAFDGSMQTMERMVPDLITFFRWTKSVIAEGWRNAGDQSRAAE